MMGIRSWVTVLLTLYAAASGLVALVLAARQIGRLHDFESNRQGDPERLYVDECMRDYEGLPKDDAKYVAQRRQCVENIGNVEHLGWLPKIRLTVDERICDPENLCASGDPGQCLDDGNETDTRNFKPGNVTRCYALMDQVRNERVARKRDQLNAQIDQKCTAKDAWKDYKHQVSLDYCMLKHRTAGACTNGLRTSCNPDGSCCPRAQEDPAGLVVRFDHYQCMKSPMVGLYCQLIDFKTKEETPKPCTQVTCPSFEWCRDFADIPNQCLGDACKDYRRTLVVTIASVVFLALGLACDLFDGLVFARHACATGAGAQVPKTVGNLAAAGLKLLAYLLCLAGGAESFVDTAVQKHCFSEKGHVMVLRAKDGLREMLLCTVLSSAGSLVLAPFSVWWGGKLVNVPYARVSRERGLV